MLLALFTGIFLGLVVGIPIGPVNALVIDTAMRRNVKLAWATGAGAALIDAIYSQIAYSSLSPLLARHPNLAPILWLLGGLVLAGFGLVSLRVPREGRLASREAGGAALASAFLTGIVLTVTNPAPIFTWIALAGSTMARLPRSHALSTSLGIFVGCAGWFWVVAVLSHRGRIRLGRRSIWVSRIVGGLVLVCSAYFLTKAALSPPGRAVIREVNHTVRKVPAGLAKVPRELRRLPAGIRRAVGSPTKKYDGGIAGKHDRGIADKDAGGGGGNHEHRRAGAAAGRD